MLTGPQIHACSLWNIQSYLSWEWFIFLQGWEEVTDMAVTHLLKTCLSKGAKDQAGSAAAITEWIQL